MPWEHFEDLMRRVVLRKGIILTYKSPWRKTNPKMEKK